MVRTKKDSDWKPRAGYVNGLGPGSLQKLGVKVLWDQEVIIRDESENSYHKSKQSKKLEDSIQQTLYVLSKVLSGAYHVQRWAIKRVVCTEKYGAKKRGSGLNPCYQEWFPKDDNPCVESKIRVTI